MPLSFALQARRKLYAAYVRVNALVEALVPSAGSQITVAAVFRRPKTSLCQNGSVKLVPIVKIVQVHRVFW